jgi:intracellular multiplication protein IcmV
MALKDIFKVSRKTYFNPTAWLGVSEVRGTTMVLWRILKDLFVPPVSSGREETFDAALKRLDVSEEELQERGKDYYMYSVLFLGCGIFGVLFAFYIFIKHHTFAGFLLGLAAGALFLAQSFRYHFWFFQIKCRRLGCTIEEWKEFLLSGKGLIP